VIPSTGVQHKVNKAAFVSLNYYEGRRVQRLPGSAVSVERQNKSLLVFYLMGTLRNFCCVVMHAMTRTYWSLHVAMTFVLGVTQKPPLT
jgi:hypothetical protein